MMKISILLATYKRPESLFRTLTSFCRLEDPGAWEVLIVNNGCDQPVRKVVKSFKRKLPVKYYEERRRGKNIALNMIVSRAKGDVFVFTDDDIVADRNWLKEIRAGVKRWPRHFVFGGKILPRNPHIIPEEYQKFGSYPYLFSAADWNIPEGEYEYAKVFGPNMIVRADIFKQGHRFDEKVGPGSGNYIAGGETEFLQRLYFIGHTPVYLPGALVYHQIRFEQCEWNWIRDRAFREGRSLSRRELNESHIRIFGVPRYLYRAYVEALVYWFGALLFFKDQVKERVYIISKFHGVFYQYWVMRADLRKLTGGRVFVDQRTGKDKGFFK